MRVLHVIDNLSPGGTERQCVELVRNMSARRIENAVFYFRAGALLTELQRLGAMVRAAPPVSLKSATAPYRLVRIACMIAGWAPDVVQTYGFYSNVPGMLAALFARVPVRVAGRRDLAAYLSPAQRFADRWAWTFAHRVVANSEAVRQHIINRDGMPLDKVVVIRNGLNLHDWMASLPSQTNDAPAVVGMVAHFRPQKDHLTFLRAASEILNVLPSVRFCLVGSGPLESAIRESAHQLGIADRIDFRIGMHGAPLRAAVRTFRVSALSSKNNEGLPNAVLESMAAGIPVVATAVGGTPEVIDDGETGFLVPTEDPSALAKRIILLLKEPSLARVMGERGRQKIAREFTMDRMTDQFVMLYRTLLAKAGRGAS